MVTNRFAANAVLPNDPLFVCTIPKSGCSGFRATLLHASGFWDYSASFKRHPSSVSLAADLMKGDGHCWSGAKKPCRHNADMNSDSLHNEFMHAFGSPSIVPNSRFIEVMRDPKGVRAVLVRHPVTRFISGTSNKILGRLNPGPFAAASQWIANAKEIIARELGMEEANRLLVVSLETERGMLTR